MAKAIPFSEEQNRRAGCIHGDAMPCYICGRAVDNEKAAWIEVTGGGVLMLEPGEPVDRNDPGYMGCYPVGPECKRKLGPCARSRTALAEGAER